EYLAIHVRANVERMGASAVRRVVDDVAAGFLQFTEIEPPTAVSRSRVDFAVVPERRFAAERDLVGRPAPHLQCRPRRVALVGVPARYRIGNDGYLGVLGPIAELID